MFKRNMLSGLLFGMLLISALVYSIGMSPPTSAASLSANARIVPANITQPLPAPPSPRVSYAQGYRDGYRVGNNDGRRGCTSRSPGFRYPGPPRHAPRDYERGFRHGYERGYQDGRRSCRRR